MAEQDGKRGPEPQVSAVPQDAGSSSQSSERFNLIGRLVWALILVWVGGVLLADNLGYLERVMLPPVSLPWSMPLRPALWRLLILGVGALLALGVVARILLPRYREDVLGNLILVIVCISLGFGYVDLIWPLILIALGIALLVKRGSF
jgi:hypothetical protein